MRVSLGPLWRSSATCRSITNALKTFYLFCFLCAFIDWCVAFIAVAVVVVAFILYSTLLGLYHNRAALSGEMPQKLSKLRFYFWLNWKIYGQTSATPTVNSAYSAMFTHFNCSEWNSQSNNNSNSSSSMARQEMLEPTKNWFLFFAFSISCPWHTPTTA